ncbi:MAG TPA: hypothetical protein DCW45_01300 [Opitutae bacterium]|nr:hypothetical protein [Opitutae bacterium]
MQTSSKNAVAEFLQTKTFKTVLDAPSGNGWLQKKLPSSSVMDGVDLFEEKPPGYRIFWKHDLDDGLHDIKESFDLICCCEGIEHVGNPLMYSVPFTKN